MNIRTFQWSRASVRAVAALGAVLAIGPAFAQTTMGTSPAWVQAISPGTWAAVSKNTIADVDPEKDSSANPNYPNNAPWRGQSGQSSVTSAWNGGAFASGYGASGSLIAWGGGHQDYYGNEIYAFDLATQRWNRVTNPYKGTISFPYTDGIFPDGSPVPPHIYDQIEYHPGSNSLVILRTMASNTPDNVPVSAEFSFNTKTWKRGPRNSASHAASGGWSAYDSTRDVIWAEGGSGTTAFTRFDPKADGGSGKLGSWTNYSPHVEITDAVGARDPLRDILLVTGFREGPDIYAVDLKNPANSAVIIKQSGSAPSRTAGHGWEWSDARQAFLYWSSGSGVYELKLSGSDWKAGSWVWTNLTSGGSAPASSPDAPYSRFRVARFSDTEIALVVSSVNSQVYAFRVPGAGQAVRPNPPTAVTVQ